MNKNKKYINKIFILIILIVILLIAYKIIDTYAVFQNEIQGNVKCTNGKWNISINGKDITNGIDKDFVVNNINISQDNYVKPGKIAPGLNGNFGIEINPQNTDVSLRYDIKITNSGNNIKITDIKEVKEGNTLIKTAPDTYTGIIPLEKIKTGITNEIQISIGWTNDEANNIEDTKLGKNPTHNYEIPISVHLEQYLGEEIVEFVEQENI